MVDVLTVPALAEPISWPATLPQLLDGFWPTGGPVDPATDSGIMNWQASLLGSRTQWLRDQLTGYGGYYPAGAGANIDTLAAWARGLYSDANAGVWPLPASGRFWFVETQPLYSVALRQRATLYALTGTPELDVYERTKSNAGTWGSWRRVWQTGATQSDLNGTGYQVLPDGFIRQWGTTAVFNASSVTISFPISFPNKIFGVYPVHNGTEDRYYSWLTNGASLSTAIIYAHTGSAPVSTTNKVTWYAIGN